MNAYSIDLAIDGKITPLDQLEVLTYEPDDLRYELEEFGATKPEELTDWDRMVFSSKLVALAFLRQYKAVYRALGALCKCQDRNLPALGYRRRNLVQTLMGMKMSTSRDFRAAWAEPGQLFNLHDRTYFLTVRLVSITKIKPGEFEYRFSLP